MSRPESRAVLSQIRRLAEAQAADEFPDRELLERFRRRRDEAAFAALVRRHGPLVWGVCWRVLGDRHDAEDAFQASFLVLAGKAGTIRRAESLGAWLYRVARQLAIGARGRRARRQRVESGHPPDDRAALAAGAGPPEELSLREALAILDDEVGRLPEKFRAPVVLCYLQGKTNEEAARELGCAPGTLKWRLGRARELLGGRLAARGVSLPAGATTVLLASGAGQAAAATFPMDPITGASAGAARLAQALIRGMTMTRIKRWALGLLALAVVGVGAAGALRQAAGSGGRGAVATAAQGGGKAQRPAARADRHGDPLPPRALARLGTVRWRHGTRARALTFAAGGKELVTAGPDGQVCVWDLATGRELRRLGKRAEPGPGEEPLFSLRPIALSADGRRAATCDDGGVHVWDAVTGKKLRRFPFRNPNHVFALVLTPDGRGLLTSSHEDRIALWDVATGRERRHFEIKNRKNDPCSNVGAAAFSPDGKLLAAPFFEGGIDDQPLRTGVRLWDVATGKEVHRFGGPVDEADSALEWPQPVFSPDGKVVARLALDGTAHLHNTADGKERLSLGRAQEEAISAVVFSPDGRTLAASLGDGRVRLYDPRTGKALHTFAPGVGRHRVPGEATHMEHDGTEAKPDGSPPLAFSPDGKVLAAVAEQNAVRLWDTATGKPLPGLAGHRGAVAELALPADGKVVVTRGTDGTLRRWERATGKELGRVMVPVGAGVMALSRSGRLFAHADETTAVVGDVAEGKAVVKIVLPEDPTGLGLAYQVRFSPDEQVLATGELSGAVRLWDAASGKALRALTPDKKGGRPDGGLLSVLEFSPDGRTLLTVRAPSAVVALPAPLPGEAPGESKSHLCLWNPATGAVLRRWQAPGRVTAVAFTPDGRGVLTAAADRLTLWDVATGQERFHVEGAAVVACSPEGRVLAAGGGAKDGSAIRLLDLRTGKEYGRLTGHQAAVRALAFTPDGTALVSGSADSTGLVWEVARPAP
jgi:RNA polymerase sigma factor (sigma-70 family)